MWSTVFASGNPALHLIKITMRHNTRIKSSSNVCDSRCKSLLLFAQRKTDIVYACCKFIICKSLDHIHRIIFSIKIFFSILYFFWAATFDTRGFKSKLTFFSAIDVKIYVINVTNVSYNRVEINKRSL